MEIPESNRVESPHTAYRALHASEIVILEANGNMAEDWTAVRVTDPFDPASVRNNRLYGTIRIGALKGTVLNEEGMALPTGIYDSFLRNCIIGDDTVVRSVRYCAGYNIGSRCILSDIGELYAAEGSTADDEHRESPNPVRISVMNESGGRTITAAEGMLPADAALWARYRDDAALMRKLEELTAAQNAGRGYAARIGDGAVLRSCGSIRDTKIGPGCRITGTDRMRNVRLAAGVIIGEGTSLEDGVIASGGRVLRGVRAERFLMGENARLDLGARVIDTVIGDNSVISCCEVLNSLIFPGHEQHHNNSFLIAALVMGQSNIAAGATIGSNHNSRAADNELAAGRGFWPGLCVSLKHPSRFASYTLLAKGAYPAELNIPLPFSLVNTSETRGRLEIMPAYWWNYNMYALVRNSAKYSDRDQRREKRQHLVFGFLAPDTAEEIWEALKLLKEWTAEDLSRRKQATEAEARASAEELLSGDPKQNPGLEIPACGVERSKRPAVVIKTVEACSAYRDMLLYYSVVNLLDWLEANPEHGWKGLNAALAGPMQQKWTSLGGQLVPEQDADKLRRDIAGGTLTTWEAIHSRYDELWQSYTLQRQKHAYGIFRRLTGSARPAENEWTAAVEEVCRIQEYIPDRAVRSRSRDYEDPFKRITFRSPEEQKAVIGDLEENSFLRQLRRESADTLQRLKQAL